jgi:type IV pilus assembly protein PilQ
VPDALVRARTLLEGLDRRKQQVLVEARIVEASSELSRTLSVTWGTRFGLDAQRGLSSGILFPNSIIGNVGGAGSLGSNAPAPGQGMGPTQLGSMGFTLGSINGMVNIDGILRAYETESLANIIASPRIVVQDQEEATIDDTGRVQRNVLVGGENSSRSTNSKLFLSVKPQITSDNTLELELQVQRTTPNNAPTDPVQGTTDRTVKTKLIVENGETAVIGGLYQTQKFKGQGRIPFLGRLPIIGFLFRTNDSQSARSELMVLITPRILPNAKGGNSPVSAPAGMMAPTLNTSSAPTNALPNSLQSNALDAPPPNPAQEWDNAENNSNAGDNSANGSSSQNSGNTGNSGNVVNSANSADGFGNSDGNASSGGGNDAL